MRSIAHRRAVPAAQMRTLTILLAIASATCTVAVAQEPDGEAGIVQELRTLEYSKFDALQHKDSGGLNAIFDNSLIRVDSNGLLWNKADYLANVRKSDVLVMRVIPESMTLAIFGKVAIIVGIYQERGLAGRHPYLQRCRFIDTWAFKDGRWVCIASTATSTIS